MNNEHAKQILLAIEEFFVMGHMVSPGGLLFDDDRTLLEHVQAALNDQKIPERTKS
jgi:hypothetical protein